MKVTALEKVSFSDIQNRKTVNALTADDKHYLLNRDNLTQPIVSFDNVKQNISK